MLKLRTLLASTLALSLVACCNNSEPTLSQRMVESHGLGDFYCNRHYQETSLQVPLLPTAQLSIGLRVLAKLSGKYPTVWKVCRKKMVQK